jgi:hypothetical protein
VLDALARTLGALGHQKIVHLKVGLRVSVHSQLLVLV